MFRTAATPPSPSASAAPAAPSPPGTDDKALIAFRQALGVPPNQPAPEAKVIEAVSGKLGTQVQEMARAIGATASPDKSLPSPSGQTPGSAEPPTTRDPGQAGGQAPEPPDPRGPSTTDSSAVSPGAGSGGAMRSSEIFGTKPVGNLGSQQDEDEDEDAGPPTSHRIFGR